MFFFFNDTATTEIYTLSLHDALPILLLPVPGRAVPDQPVRGEAAHVRSEEHTSELQSRQYLVCRLLLEKKKLRSAREPVPGRSPCAPPRRRSAPLLAPVHSAAGLERG